ncbi:DUF305 domain-containing protein [Altererythrobacter sp. H2]|uniref:DUF305 domain-containing protein n=1 Tax=Altererythrobacter sp. H2 TaxID=3108391 RepID=UPI002B4BF1F1|nr:DUF305 domain-containing protein [Altererythrobacter sp. H2]WRK96399.1 DUF305 domain-containing protein [Altererythrobacter sp. H2]
MFARHSRQFTRLSLAASLLASASAVAAQEAPIIQPGAPGEAPRVIGADEATRLAALTWTPADIAFMQGMIVHHQQAVEMAALVKGRTSREEIVAVAGRIDASQADEIAFMRGWLEERSEPVAMAGMGHAHHTMKGMASPEDMARLATLDGVAFERLFLQLMIAHHRGALDMVEDLLRVPGTAFDPGQQRFVNDVETDQKAEIERMNALYATLSEDPRATLAAGFADAGEAILNLRKVVSLAKPAGFVDPANPAGLQPVMPKKEDKKDGTAEAPKAETAADPHAGHRIAAAPAATAAPPAAPPAAGTPPPAGEEADAKPQFGKRGSPFDFANTDMAFSGDLMVAGNYHGWNAYRLGEDGVPTLVSSVVCPGGQGDVSVVGNLLIMSVEQTTGRVDCGLQGVPERISAERFRGLRIFDISDVTRPRQVGQVQTCRGSHTHSIVSADAERLVVYNSGTSGVRDEKELAGCIGDDTGDTRTALFSIDVIEIPVADPSKARIVDSPRVFAAEGQIAGLWRGGDHGDGTQDTYRTDQCHDITVFPARKLAAGACSGNGIVFDISDPMKPKRIDAVTDKGFAYWHSATFNNDGSTVIFTDEWGGGGRPRCQAGDPKNWGANAFYGVENGKLVYRGTYKLPAPQGDKENCVAHNGSIIPVPGRDLFVQAWYQGGISVIDFTDAANPQEIAYFDRGPVDKDQLVVGGYWSAYWYRGRIYATEITRGLDVFALEPSQFLTAEEIAAAEAAIYPGDVFNPQTQTQVTWPADVAAAAEASRKGG